MIASEKANHSKKIGRNKLDYFRKNIESWEKMGEKESLDGDAELATILTEGVTDLRKILRLIETWEYQQAVEAINDLDTMASDQIPDVIYNAIIPGY